MRESIFGGNGPLAMFAADPLDELNAELARIEGLILKVEHDDWRRSVANAHATRLKHRLEALAKAPTEDAANMRKNIAASMADLLSEVLKRTRMNQGEMNNALAKLRANPDLTFQAAREASMGRR